MLLRTSNQRNCSFNLWKENERRNALFCSKDGLLEPCLVDGRELLSNVLGEWGIDSNPSTIPSLITCKQSKTSNTRIKVGALYRWVKRTCMKIIYDMYIYTLAANGQ